MKKQKIIDSAIRIMADNSYSNTTTRMIALEAEIAVGSIYTHFKSKDDILDYLFESEYEKRKQFLNSLEISEGSNLSKLLQFIDFHFLELKLNENLTKVLIRESSNPDLADLEGIRKFSSSLPNEFAKIIESAIKDNEIRAVDPTIVSNIIFNLIRGSVYSVAISQSGSLDAMKREVVIFIEKALRKDNL
jgi:AcrR family transcriptional regulator